MGPVDDFHPMHSHMDVTFPAPCLGSPVAMSATYCVCAQAEKILRDFDTDGSRSLELAEWEVVLWVDGACGGGGSEEGGAKVVVP